MGGTDDPEIEREWSAIHAAVELAAEAAAPTSDAPPSTDDAADDAPETRDDGVDAFDSPELGDVHDGDL
jgi:hypothetical protein